MVVCQWGPIPTRSEPRRVLLEMVVGTSLWASPHSVSHVVFCLAEVNTPRNWFPTCDNSFLL